MDYTYADWICVPFTTNVFKTRIEQVDEKRQETNISPTKNFSVFLLTYLNVKPFPIHLVSQVWVVGGFFPRRGKGYRVGGKYT